MARPADPNAKDALVAAARAEFAKKGLRGARVEDITAACGLSKGAFYLHFESKEGLFKALVDEFIQRIAQSQLERIADMERAIAEQGALEPGDFRAGSRRLHDWHCMELKHDIAALEVMWRYRDVLDVLLTGAQGTPFEKTMWNIVDAEVARIAESHRQFQGAGCLRPDAPPEFIGAMIVGTYVLIGKRMATMTEKPDLELWARWLQKLMHEGLLPRDETPRDTAAPLESAPQTKRTAAVKKSKGPRTSAARSDR